ncbi:hypothetical protein Lal_00040149, partial [Lupinus albus]
HRRKFVVCIVVGSIGESSSFTKLHTHQLIHQIYSMQSKQSKANFGNLMYIILYQKHVARFVLLSFDAWYQTLIY